MKLPKTFKNYKNVEENIHKVLNPEYVKPATFKELVYRGAGIVNAEHPKRKDNLEAVLDTRYGVESKFDDDTKIFLQYARYADRGEELTLLPGSELSLRYISIETQTNNPLDLIEKTFSDRLYPDIDWMPFGGVKFVLTEDYLIKGKIPKIGKYWLRKKNPLYYPSTENIFIDKLMLEHVKEKRDEYSSIMGHFGRIYRAPSCIITQKTLFERTFGEIVRSYTDIYNSLPFTEKEREILSNMKEFKTSHRFPKLYIYTKPEREIDKKEHSLEFKINKKNDKYVIKLALFDGWANGFELETLAPAKDLTEFIMENMKFRKYEEKVFKHECNVRT
ncbi:MAG: hypothetical protein L6408_03275 [Nanoarchaeota archaeon]|nr:hypothetical protein [Nanoarchaeota archaeon]